MEVVGEAILSALLEPLVAKLTSGEFLRFARKKQIDAELKKWESRLMEINLVLNDAEEKQITNPAVENWLSNLRDLAYDAEDILDEFATEAFGSKLRGESQASPSTKRKLISSSCISLKPTAVIRNLKMGSKLKEITTRLEEIVTQKDDFNLRTNDQWKSRKVNEREATTSLVKESKVYGREDDKEAVVDWLMSGKTSSSSFSVISIVGMGGVGKTTLAQCVYNDKRVEFDCKAWACVSDNFDIGSISKAILSHWERCEDDNLVQVKLKEKLSGKKFLIVLDDVWNENYEKWTTLCSSFLAGAPGSKIIVTTRSKDVSSMVGSAHTYELKELSNDDCLSLFAQHALDAENFDRHFDLKEMGQEIVKRCKGLPLAAKTLGGLLRGKQKEKWEDILNSNIWELDNDKSGILPSLRLSYHHLPSHLKQCFAFCGVFPKDFQFSEDDLVLLWMAEGFLQQRKKQMRMEKLGHIYFQDLVARSFFQQFAGDKSKYVMHDLISDLAQFVSKGICFNLDDKVEGENYKSLAKVRYIAFTRYEYDISKRFELLHQMRGLRMLLPIESWDSSSYVSSHVVNNLVPKLKTLRVLSLVGYHITQLPSSIAGLKHVRLLNLSGSIIEMLPESLCELYNMQTLILFNCWNLKKLPDGFGNLINLIHLDIRGTDELQEMPLGMGNLINLSILSKFIVGKDKGLGIGELKELSHLQRHIIIERLDNVVKIQDAEDANLKKKHDLRGLRLEWSSRFDESLDKNHEEQVLNALRPHRNIEELTISHYAGTRFPSWIGDISFSNMVFLGLYYCRNVTSMPPLGGLPFLEDLFVFGMDGIKELGLEFYGEKPFSSQPKVLFPSLKRLTFSEMSNWEWWSNKPSGETTIVFPNLRDLKLKCCPKLAQMYLGCLPLLENLLVVNCQQLVEWSNKPIEETTAIFPNLRVLKLLNCTKLVQMNLGCVPLLKSLTVRGCQQLVEWSGKSLSALSIELQCNQMLLENMPDFSSLTRLEIRRISGLEHLNKELVDSLEALEYVIIGQCYNLKHLWQDGIDLKKLDSLKMINLFDCGEMVSLVEGGKGHMPCNLQALSISQCPLLKKLAVGFRNLTHLKRLMITHCKQLTSLNGEEEDEILPSSLEQLNISYCDELAKLPNGFKNLTHLSSLEIVSCPKLEVFPAGGLPCSITDLKIEDCRSLKILPEGIMKHGDENIPSPNLKSLEIRDFPSLVIYPGGQLPPSLESLSIPYEFLGSVLRTVPNLTSLGDLTIWRSLGDLNIGGADNLSALSNLTSLQTLHIASWGMDSFGERGLPPNLTTLVIYSSENLKQPMPEWGLHRLTSLTRLEIKGPSPSTDTLVSFPQLQLPTSLTHIAIDNFNNLKSISSHIRHLTSLEKLEIRECPKLRCLPKSGLPPTLGSLRISACPLLDAKECIKKYEHITANVPFMEFDYSYIIGGKAIRRIWYVGLFFCSISPFHHYISALLSF